MSKAEEFYLKRLEKSKKYDFDKRRLKNFIINEMEAYLKHEVNAMSDKDIIKGAISETNKEIQGRKKWIQENKHDRRIFKKGAYWHKNKILKQ